MSQENVELTRQAVAAFNAHDLETLINVYDPQIELHSTFAAVGGMTVYHGHDGVRKYWADLEEAWGGEIRIEPEAYFDLGEHTLAFTVLHGRGKQSGAEATQPVAMLATWRDGLMVYFKGYADKQDALEDLGVSPDVLEAIAP